MRMFKSHIHFKVVQNKMLLITGLLILSLAVTTACGTTDGNEEEGSPRTIVFSAQNDAEGTFQIFSMREDGSGMKQLTDGEFSSSDPAWSPDGSRIAYARSTGSTAGDALWVMDADGSNKQPLVTNPQTGSQQLGNRPVWSPDGTKLAFDRCLDCEFGGKNVEVFVADLQTGAIDTLTDHPVEDSHPTWSPDGQQIAFTSNRDFFDADTMRFRKDIYIVNENSTGLQRITQIGNATRPVWSPDGNKIAYEWNIRGNEVFIYKFATRQIIKLETGLEFAGEGMWDRKGTKLLVIGRETENAQVEMRLLEIENDQPEVLMTVPLNENTTGRDYDWYDNQ